MTAAIWYMLPAYSKVYWQCHPGWVTRQTGWIARLIYGTQTTKQPGSPRGTGVLFQPNQCAPTS